MHARLRNETGTTAARGLLFLYGAHGTSAGTWVVVEHKTRVPVPAGVNHTSDFSSAPIALAGGYGGLGTGHPCARVYVLPPDLPVFGVPGALKTNAELEAWLEANVGCLEAAHFAQKNLSAADSGTCACSGAPAAPTFSSPPGPRQLAGIDEATKDLVVRFGPEIAGLVGQGKMVAKIAVRGSTIVPDTEASPYDFVEDLGGFVDLVEVEDVRRPEGAAFEFEIANPTPFPRSVWLVPELWAPKHAGPVGLNLDLGPFRMEPGEVRTIRAALLPEARCAECCLQVFAEEKGLLTLEAEHHHRRLEGDRSRWIPRGPGNRLSGLFAMEGSPLFGNDRYAEGKAPARLDYRVRFETPGKYRVWARGYHPVSPVSERGFSLRVALLDSGPEESGAGLVRFPVAEIPFWIGEDLERGEAVVVVAKPGERILSVWLEEPATVLDKVVLSREGIAPEGDGPAESSTMPSCQPSEPPPVGPVRIRAANDGRAVVLSWDGGGVLQFAPEIPRTGSPVVWKDLGGSNSPVTLPVLDRQRFYRLRR
ncbi:MAG: hypothetical protein JNL97_13875 [Verrucomicrobiales bacterium]|nr:hypothetical protein [Verrucomicrobiales bacterium]